MAASHLPRPGAYGCRVFFFVDSQRLLPLTGLPSIWLTQTWGAELVSAPQGAQPCWLVPFPLTHASPGPSAIELVLMASYHRKGALRAGRALPLPLPTLYIHSSDARTEVTGESHQETNIRPSSAQDSFNTTSGIPQESVTCRWQGRAPASGHLSSLVSFIGLLVAFLI